MISLDFHNHSHYSFDCVTTPERILDEARRKGLNGVAVTDHDTIEGGLATASANRDPNFLVIVGAEYDTEAGDIIGLFLQKEVTTRNPYEVIEDIHRQGGIALMPHPFHGHDSPSDMANMVDMVEVFNSRENAENNKNAFQLAKELNKPMTCGSDAHLVGDIGTCRMKFSTKDIRAELLAGHSQMVTGYTPRYRMSASQIVKAAKLRRYHHIPYHAARLIKRLIMRE